MMAFKVGDKVQLQSGGPAMTVIEVNGSDVTCTWFAGQEPRVNAYPSAALRQHVTIGPQGGYRGTIDD